MKTYCRKIQLNHRYLDRQKQERKCGWTLALLILLVVFISLCIRYQLDGFIVVHAIIHLTVTKTRKGKLLKTISSHLSI